MLLDGGFRDGKFKGNLLIEQAIGQHRQNLVLVGCEKRQALGKLARLIRQLAVWQIGRVPVIPLQNTFDGLSDLRQRCRFRNKSRYSYRLTAINNCLLYTSPSPRDRTRSRMPSSA